MGSKLCRFSEQVSGHPEASTTQSLPINNHRRIELACLELICAKEEQKFSVVQIALTLVVVVVVAFTLTGLSSGDELRAQLLVSYRWAAPR